MADSESLRSRAASIVKTDVPASIVVFLVAIPLCLGIALASGAPAISGLISGVVGGIVVALLSGSSLSVSGPAAGLTSIVALGIASAQSYEVFLVSVVLAGLMQLVLGLFKLGVIGHYVPNAVIRGMLAAIGLILIKKQLPHVFGLDEQIGDLFRFSESWNPQLWFSALNELPAHSSGTLWLSFLGFGIYALWQLPFMRNRSFSTIISAPLAVVCSGVLFNELPLTESLGWKLSGAQLVQLPVFTSMQDIQNSLQIAAIQQGILLKSAWMLALTIALVASLETLLSIEASDRIDPLKRISDPNRELLAQGAGNLVSGALGGLPLTSVIVRTSANVNAGGKTRVSAFLHGLWLLLAFLFVPQLLNQIPNASLAVILIVVGYKLIPVSLIGEMYRMGRSQFLPFMTTILAVLFTDLLTGIGIGLLLSLYFVLATNFKKAVFMKVQGKHFEVVFKRDVTFLNKPLLRKYLRLIPEGSHVVMDAVEVDFMDKDIIQELNVFCQMASERRIDLHFQGFSDEYLKLMPGQKSAKTENK